VPAKYAVVLLSQSFAPTIRTTIILLTPFYDASDVEKVLAFRLQKGLVKKTDTAFLLRKELDVS
jgi:hypothetical protein